MGKINLTRSYTNMNGVSLSSGEYLTDDERIAELVGYLEEHGIIEWLERDEQPVTESPTEAPPKPTRKR
jgi:hypothetical protein